MVLVDPILTTKIFIPAVRADLSARPRLVEKLNGALNESHKLILISAPAGFGKTTLVAEWLRQVDLPAAWVSLDKEDNNPSRFWHYVISAFQTVEAGLGQTTLAALEATQLPPLESMLTALINDLSKAARPMLLVLDDYHYIEAESIHNSLNFLLDHLPVRVCVVITTRLTPPLALARLRGRGQLTEARTADLRFTMQETQAFLNTVNHLDLPDEDVASLENRTEGWIVGLQMAVLSLRVQRDKHAFVTAFAGDDHYVVDYLLEEVLQQQKPDVQTFLMQTSILERLSGPLCEAVTGRADSLDMLIYLELANLFVTCLDNRRYWFRYHHLFADLLQRRLRQAMAVQDWKGLYRRACAWYEQEGLVSEAVSQALVMPDFELAADLLDKHILKVFYRSETVMVHHWLQALPEEVIRTRPLLCAVYANTLAHMNTFGAQSLQQAGTWLKTAKQALTAAEYDKTASANRPDSAKLRSFIELSYAYLALWRNDPPEKVISLAQHALSGLPPPDEPAIDPDFLRFHSGLNCNLGMSYMRVGDHAAASLAFAKTRQIGEACGDLLNASAAVACQCTMLWWQGRLPEAVSLCEQALRTFCGDGQRPESSIPFVGIVYSVLGQIQVEWNNLEVAEPILMKGLELSKLTTGIDIRRNVSAGLAHLRQARDDPAGALAELDQVEQNWPEITTYVDAYRVRSWLAQGNREAAVQWAKDRPIRDMLDPETLSLARVIIALQTTDSQPFNESIPDLSSLMQYLERKIEALHNTIWVGLSIELSILYALACQALDDNTGAINSLQRAVTLAEPGGFIRLFVDEGAPMRLLMAKLKNNNGSPQAYINKLLTAWMKVDPDMPFSFGLQSAGELLSAREMEVLRLLAAGRSNAEIALKLVITLNTTKKHLSNIFGKLAVANRRDAVRRAREMGLVI
jgi:LuxR family transcriptional regulator, maltose regulon positive regulatory protein